MSHGAGVTGWRVLFCCCSRWKAAGGVKQSLPSSFWRCPSWDPPTSALSRRWGVSETGALTRGPSLLSATAAPQPGTATRRRPVVPYRQRLLTRSSQGPQGGGICIFTTMQMRRGAQRDLEAAQRPPSSWDRKGKGGGILTQVFGGWAPAPEPPPHKGWEPSRGSVDCRG